MLIPFVTRPILMPGAKRTKLLHMTALAVAAKEICEAQDEDWRADLISCYFDVVIYHNKTGWAGIWRYMQTPSYATRPAVAEAASKIPEPDKGQPLVNAVLRDVGALMDQLTGEGDGAMFDMVDPTYRKAYLSLFYLSLWLTKPADRIMLAKLRGVDRIEDI